VQIHKKGRIYDYKDFMRAVAWFVGEGDARAPEGSAARQGLGLKSPTFAEAYARTVRERGHGCGIGVCMVCAW